MTPLLAPLLLAAAAHAADVQVLADGAVQGRMTLEADADAVLSLLDDSAALAATSPDVRAAQATRAGACDAVELTVKGLFSPFEVHTRRCRTATGWEETLVRSEVFSAWEAAWDVRDRPGGGSEVTYRVRTELDLPVPAGIVRSRTARSVALSMAAVERAAADAVAVADDTGIHGPPSPSP